MLCCPLPICAQSDDFLSWLLVHVDDVDAKLEVDESTFNLAVEAVDGMAIADCDDSLMLRGDDPHRADVPAAAGRACSDGSSRGLLTAATTSTNNPAAGREGDELLVPSPSQGFAATVGVDSVSNVPGKDSNTPPALLPDNELLGLVSPSIKASSTAAMAGAVVELPGSVSTPSLSSPGAVPGTLGISSLVSSGWPQGAVGAEVVGVGVRPNTPVAGSIHPKTVSSAPGLTGQLEVGGIPSDPLLAMQMGARMALTGEVCYEGMRDCRSEFLC